MKTFKGYLEEAGPVGLQHQTSVDVDGQDEPLSTAQFIMQRDEQ